MDGEPPALRYAQGLCLPEARPKPHHALIAQLLRVTFRHFINHGTLDRVDQLLLLRLSLDLAFVRCNKVFMLFADNRALKPCGWLKSSMGCNLDRISGCSQHPERTICGLI